MKLKEAFVKYKSQIVVGVICSIITALLLNIGEWILEAVPSAGTGIGNKLVNTYYTIAAKENGNEIPLLLLSMFLGVIVAAGLSIAKKGIIVGNAIDKIIKIISLSENAQSESERKSLMLECQKIAEKAGMRNSQDQNYVVTTSKKVRRAGITLILLVVVLVSSVFGFVVGPITTYTKFQRDIIMINPYIESAESIKLQSDWVLMKSKADYIKIYRYINGIKETHDLP